MDDWSIAGDIPEGRPTPPPQSIVGPAGDYRIVGALGTGGAGEVFRAVDAAGREVALKLLRRFDDPKRVERFLREGQMAAALRHPNVIAIHEAGVFQGRPFLAYELVEGPSFDRALREKALPERLELFTAVVDGVAFAHAQGVVHRDLKPENILVGRDGRPRVADFGLGLAERDDDRRLTQSGALVGTPRYMSPEQARGETRAHGPPTDVWALGVMLYEALTGRLPFNATSLAELVVEINAASPVPPRKHVPAIPRAVEAVCLKAISAQPSDRYSDAGELARALIAAQRSPEGRAMPWVWVGVAALGAVVVGLGAAVLIPSAPSPAASAARTPIAPAVAEIDRHIKGERFERAMALTLSLRKEHPESAVVWLTHADILANKSAWKEALVSYERASKLDPSSSRAYAGRGMSKAQLGRNDEALADLDRAVGLDPKHADALEKRSLLHYRRRAYEAALADAKRAADLAPASAEAKNARGLARAALGDRRGAVIDLEEALALDRDPSIMSNLGSVLIQDGRVDEGLRYLEEAASLAPNNHATWQALGVAALKAGRLESALTSFTRALTLRPTYAEARYARAVTLRRLGRTRPAVRDLERLIVDAPEHPDARRAQALLTKIRGGS